MATLSDVAQRAGVTAATVSYVLSGKAQVKDETRARVLQAVEDLGYKPNLLARGLAQGKTFTIAAIVPEITNPYYAEIINEVEHIAGAKEYHILLAMSHGNPKTCAHLLDRFSSRWVDGFLIMGGSANPDLAQSIIQTSKPLVLSVWENDPQLEDIPCFDIDFYDAGMQATKHLLHLGHSKIAIILEEPIQHTRFLGFKDAMQHAGMEILPEYIQAGDSSYTSGFAAAQKLLQIKPMPTALFAANDAMAIGAIEAIHQAGLAIPSDISVIGVDDILLAEHSYPPLTTIRTPRRQLAKLIIQTLLAKIEDPKLINFEKTATLLKPHIIIRSSTTSPQKQIY